MAAQLASAQAPAGSVVGHARDATEALTLAGPWVGFLLCLAALWYVDRDRGRLIAAAAAEDVAHRGELEARRAEHLEDLRRFTGETQILAGRIVEERERQSARFARWEQLLEDIRDELRGKR